VQVSHHQLNCWPLHEVPAGKKDPLSGGEDDLERGVPFEQYCMG
jgi:hypothetical protein